MATRNGSTKSFEELAPDERETFSKYLKVFLGYEDDIKDTRESQREQILQCANEIDGLSKKDIRKMFNYFKKGITASQLREDADALEEIDESLSGGSDNVDLDV